MSAHPPLLPPHGVGGPTLQHSLLVPILLLLLLALASTPSYSFRGTPVDLPVARGGIGLIDSRSDVTVSVRRDATVCIDTSCYPAAAFPYALYALDLCSPARRFTIRVDRSLPFGIVRTLLKGFRDAGHTRVTLVTYRNSPPTFP